MSEVIKDPISYALSHGANSDELEKYKEIFGSYETLAAHIQTSIENGVDWRTGKPKDDMNSENQEAVFDQLEYTETKGAPPKIKCTAQNFLIAMRADKAFDNIKYNVLMSAPVIVNGNKYARWTNADSAKARIHIENAYHLYNKDRFSDAFSALMAERPFDPIQEKINTLVWDGVPRVENFFIKWLGSKDDDYSRECARLVFAGGINRAYEPGCKFDCVIVLQGKQGSGKSTICQWLAMDPDLYNSTKTIQGSKGFENIDGKWIVEFDELLATLANDRNGSNQDEICKQFISTQCDRERRPYEKYAEDHPRRCIFIGTTNRSEFLSDKTGNRRWYPLETTSSGSYLYKHKEECQHDIEQCWAEMKAAFDNNEDLASPTVRPEMESAVKQAQAKAELDDWREGAIAEYLEHLAAEGITMTCTKEVWDNAIADLAGKLAPSTSDTKAVGMLLKKLHCTRAETNKYFKGYGSQKAYILPQDLTAAY